ncbi:DUF1266 domain-containing protein [Salinicola aestuarinus]|uniref:DUF1266 domain-containing protein n=1 Tax=Salinicola aestuarinus TaxID=1949082 RepID=UPI001FD8873E|nr:DUF1266 domain-containing protein [Salinicola aestuarinus]
MHDILLQWWAQQLKLCGWPSVADPRDGLSVEAVSSRLAELRIGDADEFAWRLWESVSDRREPALSNLLALELLALGVAAGWIDGSIADRWFVRVAHNIVSDTPTLSAWCRQLNRLGDAELDRLIGEMLRDERQGKGPRWERVSQRLDAHAPVIRLPWADDLWRARAVVAPVLAWPLTRHDGERQAFRQRLKVEDAVTSRAKLLETIEWLTVQGDRYGWEMDGWRLQREGAKNAEAWLASLGEQCDYGATLLAFVDRGEPLEWAAWDWLRMLDQAWLGYGAGWLSQEEAESIAARAVDLLQSRYADWQDVARAYQRGRSLSEGRDLLGGFEREWQLLLQSEDSPWSLGLHETLDEERRERSRLDLQAYHAAPDAWVLAIASVREPELAARQHLQQPVDAARRRDAEHYLSHVLGLAADEGIAGLSRFWMPAQSHHLNQLAADARHGAASLKGRARSRLSACADHAATIVMAEKYAFYLVMASDSGRYALVDIQSLAASLAHVLGSFYADVPTMLAAWAAWSPLLNEEESAEASALHDDLAWHRHDPGSRFHWLGASGVSGWREPGPRPQLARFTALSLAGPLNEAAWRMPQYAGEEERRSLRDWVEQQYAFQNAKDLLEFLDFLLEAGDRQEYEINYAPYTLNPGRLDSEIAMLETGDCGDEEKVHLARLRRVRDNACQCNDEDMTAWDIAQLVDLGTTGRELGWVDDAQLHGYLDAALRLARARYASWQAYAEGLYSGFGFFMDDTPERDAFLNSFREALNAWLVADPLLAGPWASLDFSSTGGRWTPMHVDVLIGEPRRVH